MSAGRVEPGGEPRFSLELHQIRILHQMRLRKLAGEAGGIARCLGSQRWTDRRSEKFLNEIRLVVSEFLARYEVTSGRSLPATG